ncbi:MAG TPA: hypothetical protein VKP89_01990, partial [Burkholderiales bacterium]|nr:hypothetical protein [Burkholderiales bacterium]
EKSLWDHTTCGNGNTRIPAMELCYVTKHGRYDNLCVSCYKKHVVAKVGILRAAVWYLRSFLGANAAA